MKLAAYHAGQVTRYHTNPRIARLGQNNAEHQWGVAVIIDQLHPNPSVNLYRAAIRHDGGELGAGDLAYPFKRSNPDFAAEHERLERLEAIRIGLGMPELTPEEKDWLAMADRLESILYVQLHRPDIIETDPRWARMIADTIDAASKLGVWIGHLINGEQHVTH